MRKLMLTLIVTLLWCNQLFAQQVISKANKLLIDTSVLGKWPKLSDETPVISPKGNYVAYSVDEKSPNRRLFTIQNIKTGWQRIYTDVTSPVYFFEDESEAFFQQGDILRFLPLSEHSPERVKMIKPIYQSFRDQLSRWQVYLDKSGQLIAIDLITKKEIQIGKAVSFKLNIKGTLLYTDTVAGNKGTMVHLYMYNLQNNQQQAIWKGSAGENVNINFSNDGQRILFRVFNERQSETPGSLWTLQLGEALAHLLIQENDPRIPIGFRIDLPYEFSKNGKWIFFSLIRNYHQGPPKPSPLGVAVDIWSFKDKLLQPQQLDLRISDSEKCEAAISSDGQQLHFLKKNESWAIPPKMFSGDAAVIAHQENRGFYDPLQHYRFSVSYSIMSLKSGERKIIHSFSQNNSFFLGVSPNDRWLIFYDYRVGHYFSYELETGCIRNMTKSLPVSVNIDYNMEKYKSAVDYISGWVAENGRMLIYDNYDLWALDPAGRAKPMNVTGGYGLSHHIKLRIIKNQESYGEKLYGIKDTLFFTGYNVNNKKNGVFSKVLGDSGVLKLLTMGGFHYFVTPSQIPGASDEYDESQIFVKASEANGWIVKRQSAKEAPNYFYTNSLKSFKPITNVAPELNYNWLTTKLITYKQLDGTKCQGILYKPENFEPSKKYPVIFNYYQILTSRLNEFSYPEYMVHNINIPWFVSHGYLVFTPDVYFQIANVSNKTVGENSYNSVVAAAQCLARLPYVDRSHMGIQGHSFGGLQTLYLASHSKLFAAASEMSGVSDMVSEYLALLPQSSTTDESGDHPQPYCENGQVMMGSTLWQRRDLYLRESAVLNANEIRTPLLMIHNKKDDNVPWRQGVELYMALRRLNKPSWMLQYDIGGHTLRDNSPESKDYTIRLTQFFDHYLKGYPPPVWMTRGVPAKMKGIETGYELDPKGECGPNCPICKKKYYKNFDPKLAVIKEFAKDPPPSDDN